MKYSGKGELLSVTGLIPSDEGGLIFVRYKNKKKKVKNKKSRKEFSEPTELRDRMGSLLSVSDVIWYTVFGLIVLAGVWNLIELILLM